MTCDVMIAHFERLLGALSKLRQGERNDAPRHNVFRMLGLERSEVRLHSTFLRDLLDPYGSHGQGLVFLRSFLELVAHHTSALGNIHSCLVDPPKSGEWMVEAERSRIDISIRNRQSKLIVFIENKIDAPERTNQLCDYRNRLDDECRRYNARGALVFLAPRSYGPPKTIGPENDVVHLTYEDNIAGWLRKIERDDVDPITLRGTLQQYCKIVEDMRPMSDPDPAFTNLLMERENFGIALEISKAMPSVKERLYQSFWKQIEDDLRRRARALPGAWTLISTVKTGTDENARFPSTFPDEGRFLISKELPLANTRLLVGAAQEISGRIYYGIAYSREQPVPPSVKEVSKLRENIAVKLIGEPHVWWIAWSYKELDADALLRCVADNVELTAGETSNEVFELLEHHLDAIRAADRALYFQSITHSRSSDVIDPANPP